MERENKLRQQIPKPQLVQPQKYSIDVSKYLGVHTNGNEGITGTKKCGNLRRSKSIATGKNFTGNILNLLQRNQHS